MKFWQCTRQTVPKFHFGTPSNCQSENEGCPGQSHEILYNYRMFSDFIKKSFAWLRNSIISDYII
ncbi:MAG: hypothetical protein GY795_08115 [Desulfobacterales bacterium]|nr:hypothetical protein [Desulfobacterales bacterium]